jgi:hypothetical protein
MLYELKGSSVLCPYENVCPPQKIVPYCLSSFWNYEEYKSKHSKHPKHKKYLKKKGHLGWANEMVQP